jgi:hypothetical protein
LTSTAFEKLSWALVRLSVRPTGDLGELTFVFSFSDFNPGLSMGNPFELVAPPLFKSPKSREPLLIAADIALASVLENYALYGSDTRAASLVKLLFVGWNFMASRRLLLYFGLNVLPNEPRPEYFSPDGDLGGVSPFDVGEPGYFCTLVINNGDGD